MNDTSYSIIGHNCQKWVIKALNLLDINENEYLDKISLGATLTIYFKNIK